MSVLEEIGWYDPDPWLRYPIRFAMACYAASLVCFALIILILVLA